MSNGNVLYTIVGSVSADNGRTKPKSKTAKRRAGSLDSEDHNLCLLRASTGKKTISTVVRSGNS